MWGNYLKAFDEEDEARLNENLACTMADCGVLGTKEIYKYSRSRKAPDLRASGKFAGAIVLYFAFVSLSYFYNFYAGHFWFILDRKFVD